MDELEEKYDKLYNMFVDELKNTGPWFVFDFCNPDFGACNSNGDYNHVEFVLEDFREHYDSTLSKFDNLISYLEGYGFEVDVSDIDDSTNTDELMSHLNLETDDYLIVNNYDCTVDNMFTVGDITNYECYDYDCYIEPILECFECLAQYHIYGKSDIDPEDIEPFDFTDYDDIVKKLRGIWIYADRIFIEFDKMQQNTEIKDFIYRINDSNKLTILENNYDSIDDFFKATNIGNLVIGTADTKKPMFTICKEIKDNESLFKFIVDITNEDGDNFRIKTTIKNKEHLVELIEQTIDALEAYPQFHKYIDDLKDCL